MKKLILLFGFFFVYLGGYSQTRIISGQVIDGSMKEPLIGVNIVLKGTSIGTVTDIDGNYSLEIEGDQGVLVFSYVSMKTLEENINGRSVINVSMKSDEEALEEIVVTAMGIKRESKTLSYSTQTIGGKDVNDIKNVNMINSLQGKSAGLIITPNSTGAGGASKILFRGNKSINGSNQPLIVVDGVPLMMNTTDVQVNSTYGGGRDGGDAMSTINPDDIAQISLLKGASAAALYGAVAANGAIMITTKSAQSGKVAINVSSNTTVETPVSLPKFQNIYGMSNEGTYSWGDKLSTPSPNYADDFYQLGCTTNNSISLSGGNDKFSSYFSYANISSRGLIPTNDYMSHNIMAKVGFNPIKRLRVDVSARYNNQDIDNQPISGYLQNPITGAYLFSRGEDWDYYKNNFEIFDASLNTNVHNWTNTYQDQYTNPYWILNRQATNTVRNRYEFGGSVKFDILEGLSVLGRLRYEYATDKFSQDEYASSLAKRNLLGTMRRTDSYSSQVYGDALLTYNKVFNNLYSLSATLGSSFTKTTAESTELIGWGDRKFQINNGVITPGAYYPNLFIPSNYYNLQTTMVLKEKRLNSVFATMQLGFKEAVFIDFSARNDWSSALAYTDNVSFFYPSIGGSVLINKLVNMHKNIDLLKIRSSYSIVGNDVPVFASNKRYKIGEMGAVYAPEEAPFRTLKPEKTNSIEIGFDGTFFKNRLNVNLTLYRTNTKNQFLRVSAPWETGYRYQYINAGDVQNQGVEISTSWIQDLTKNLSWKTGVNFSYNDNKILKLVDGLSDGFTMADYRSAKIVLQEGGHYGDLYVRQIKRDENGVPMKSEDGAPILGGDDLKSMKYVGDMNAKFNLSWTNSFYYKDFTLSLLIDSKLGGKVFSMTEATLDGWGVSERSGAAREVGEVVFEGVSFEPQTFYTTVGATHFNSQSAGELYVWDATNVRLRELSLGYTFRNLFGIGKNFTVSAIGRNLFFFYKEAPMDPDVSAGTTNGWQGVDVFALPTSRSFGLNLKLNF